jgi:hypothetical protein
VLELISVQDTDCGQNQGSIEVTASGGAGVYSFKLNDGESLPGSVFSDLAAGIYEITATDASDCSSSIEVQIKNQNGVNLAFETTTSGCKSSGGSIRVIPNDGVPPYNFRINNNAFQSEDVFDGLAQGQYTIAVNDATGCEVTQSIRVSSGTSFSTDIAPIIETNCAITGCHNGTQFPDFRVFNNIRENAPNIKTMTISRAMPENGTLTQAQINTISCWVDDGAPAN